MTGSVERRTRSGWFEDVGAGGGGEDLVAAGAGRLRGGLLGAGPGLDPLGPVVPPRARAAFGAGPPLVGIGAGFAADEAVGLRIAGGRDLGLDVTGGGEHERRLAGEELGGPVAPVPGGQVVGQAAGDVVVDLDARQVDGRAEDL